MACLPMPIRGGSRAAATSKMERFVIIVKPLTIITGIARPAQSTQNNFAKSLQYLKKEVGDEVYFLCRWASKLSINWYYHFWWVWPGIPEVLQIISVHCLSSISKKNWVMKLMFCMLIDMEVFYKFIVLFFMGLARHA